jgi:hypothetical protein
MHFLKSPRIESMEGIQGDDASSHSKALSAKTSEERLKKQNLPPVASSKEKGA